jgi:hypothetical protein
VPISTRIYAGNAFVFGGQPAVDDLRAAQYSSVIIWSVHVDEKAALYLNETKIVDGGRYIEPATMNLPGRLATLRTNRCEVLFSVGSGGGPQDFTNIDRLLNDPEMRPCLRDNFKALKGAMVNAGGDIDAIDFDNEDNTSAQVMCDFGSMLRDIGYAGVTFCPYDQPEVWAETYDLLGKKCGANFVRAIHLQCYDGGRWNNPDDWCESEAWEKWGKPLLIPGLATKQTNEGGWWNEGKRGGSVVTTPNVVMYAHGDWSKKLRQGNFASAEKAMESAGKINAETFFFFCRGSKDLGPGKQFNKGDAVFFAGVPWWGSEPDCDGCSLSGGCTNKYNQKGACLADLRKQYEGWKKDSRRAPDGGFIWLYDSVTHCLLSPCCGEKPATAKDYREAITNGLSQNPRSV